LALKFEPIFPGEVALDGAAEIVTFNIEAIGQADAVIANLNPFRGAEPDSGTVFECGYAYGLGKKVFGYLSDHRDMVTKVKDLSNSNEAICRDGTMVEDFGQPLNIMLAISMEKLYHDVWEAMEAAKVYQDSVFKDKTAL
ncbi:MAG: nucleoside 2-deoxyribosyltransferase, partial [Deltaproteobacteria bacterium]|nr:nucleoside 2-deoxyribosyltransferase [Deltaproteobacteria bacterium]